MEKVHRSAAVVLEQIKESLALDNDKRLQIDSSKESEEKHLHF